MNMVDAVAANDNLLLLSLLSRLQRCTRAAVGRIPIIVVTLVLGKLRSENFSKLPPLSIAVTTFDTKKFSEVWEQLVTKKEVKSQCFPLLGIPLT